jgi:predicted nucleic acid-binding protein
MQYIHDVRILVDTSVIVGVLLNEDSKERIISKTKGATLIAPASLHWEIGNVVSSLIKRKKVSGRIALQLIEEYHKISIQYLDVDLKETIAVVERHGIYAYDAYMVVCAKRYRLPLLSLDAGLNEVARKEKIRIVEV